MKTHFIQLFKYDRHANELLLPMIIKTNQTGKPVQLMAHLLAAQQVWLNRCAGLPAIGGALWPDWQADAFAALIIQNSDAWLNFLDTLQASDFKRIISYKNSKGESFENKLADVLAHVINHGTHHRAQIGQQLKFAGVEELPVTDYIFYLRTL